MVQKTDKFAILQALLLDANKRCIFQYDRNLLKLYINLTVYRKEVFYPLILLILQFKNKLYIEILVSKRIILYSLVLHLHHGYLMNTWDKRQPNLVKQDLISLHVNLFSRFFMSFKLFFK